MPAYDGTYHCFREANCAIRPRMLTTTTTTTASKDASHLADFASHTLIVLWYGSNTTAVDATHQYVFGNYCRYVLESMQMDSNISTILLSLKYIERLRKANPRLQGAPGSEYRILIVALMLANKFLDDNTYSLSAWVEVSGFPTHELVQCEKEYLLALDFRLHVGESEYLNWLRVLESFVARRIHPLPIKYRRHSTATLGLQPAPMHNNTILPSCTFNLQTSQSLNTSKRSLQQAFTEVPAASTNFKKPNIQNNFVYATQQQQQQQQMPITPISSPDKYAYPLNGPDISAVMMKSESMMAQLPPTPPMIQVTYDQSAAPIVAPAMAVYVKAMQQFPISASQFANAFPEWNFQFPTTLMTPCGGM